MGELFFLKKATYFDSFRVEHRSKEVKEFINNKKIINICRIQANDSIMCRDLCSRLINLMIKGKSLLSFTNFFSPSEFKKNRKIIVI